VVEVDGGKEVADGAEVGEKAETPEAGVEAKMNGFEKKQERERVSALQQIWLSKGGPPSGTNTASVLMNHDVTAFYRRAECNVDQLPKWIDGVTNGDEHFLP